MVRNDIFPNLWIPLVEYKITNYRELQYLRGDI